ncbi:hypothetical protein KBB12_04600 [Candidatus Woesebacteria bacterium]|nr:hypothetical protein [Candidatus Woesebacteria bacterium]
MAPEQFTPIFDDGEEKPHDPWSVAFDELFGDVVDEPLSQYTEIPRDEIEDAKEQRPFEAIMMELANSIQEEARDRAEGEREREPRFHDKGWSIALESDTGEVVGIHSNWLGKRFYVGYPTRITVSDQMIIETLGVEESFPVKHVSKTSVSSWDYEDEEERDGSRKIKDDDKPLEANASGQIIAYSDRGERRWANFYGPIEPGGGRVWFAHNEPEPNAYSFRLVSDGLLSSVTMGQKISHSIATYPHAFHNAYAYEGPTVDQEAIQKYRDKFILLAAKIAALLGSVKRIHIDYGFVFVPEEVTQEGYTDVHWAKGEPGKRTGHGNELLLARKGNQELALESGNLLEPWSSIISTKLTDDLAPVEIQSLIVEELLFV